MVAKAWPTKKLKNSWKKKLSILVRTDLIPFVMNLFNEIVFKCLGKWKDGKTKG